MWGNQNIPMPFLYVISILEIGVCYYFLFSVIIDVKKINVKNKVTVGICVVLLGALLATNRLGLFFSDNMLLFCIFVTCMHIYFFIRRDTILIIELVTIYYSAVALFDFFFSFLCIAYLGQKYYLWVYHNSLSIWSSLIFLCSRATIIFIIKFNKKMKKDVMIEFQHLLFFLCFIILFLLKIYQKILYELALGRSELKWWIAATSLITVLIFIVFFLKFKIIQKENDVLIMREELLVEQYKKMDEVLKKNRQLTHDIKNQLLIIQGMERASDLDGLHQYLIELGAKYIGVIEERWSESNILDLVINQKKREAEKENILFEIIEITYVHKFLTDGEIVTLLGNLLDNAIEACLNLEEERFIKLMIEQKENLLFIKIQNSIAKIPIIKKNLIQSTKSNRNTHGYGLKNVRDIVNKYDGVMLLSAEENIFRVDISFFSINGK